MARYDQATRQLLLLARIEASRFGLTLQELIASLPEDYARHPRTVRRDLEALELHFPIFAMRQDGRTCWKMLLCVADTPELVGWILSFGAGVRVVSPAPLRERVRAEAKKIFEQQ